MINLVQLEDTYFKHGLKSDELIKRKEEAKEAIKNKKELLKFDPIEWQNKELMAKSRIFNELHKERKAIRKYYGFEKQDWEKYD